MKEITIKLKEKIVLKDTSWLMDEKFNILSLTPAHHLNTTKREIKIIKDGLNLVVYQDGITNCGINDLQIKIIETGEKFYTRTEFISHRDCEKVLFVPEKPNPPCDISNCGDLYLCSKINCCDCFFEYENQKLWRDTL